jgi:hypothetical protein
MVTESTSNVVSISTANAPNPFDPESLRLDQSFTDGPTVKKLINTIPVRKPGKQDFVRVHPSPEYRCNVTVIEVKDDGETYWVPAHLRGDLFAECVPITLYTAINRQGVLFLWPVRLPGPDGKEVSWWPSARIAAEGAVKRWTRITANKSLGGYDTAVAEGAIPEPEWPELTFLDMIKIAFRDRTIDSLDHPLVKRLRGLA